VAGVIVAQPGQPGRVDAHVRARATPAAPVRLARRRATLLAHSAARAGIGPTSGWATLWRLPGVAAHGERRPSGCLAGGRAR